MRKRVKKPYFLWDYDLTEEDVKRILKTGNEYSRQWLVGRIVSHAHFKDVFRYLTIKEILAIWPKLRIRREIRNAWEKAFLAWGYYANAQEQSHPH